MESDNPEVDGPSTLRAGRLSSKKRLAYPSCARKTCLSEIGSGTARPQNRIDIRRVAPVRTRIADKYVEDVIPHGEAQANQQLSKQYTQTVEQGKRPLAGLVA